MTVQEHLSRFEAVAKDPAGQLKDHLARGRKVVLTAPVYTPEEILYAMDLVPMGAWGGDMELRRSKEYFPAFICSIAQSIVELGMAGAYEGASAIVIPSLCDSLKVLGQNWKYAVPSIPFIPMTWPQNRKPDYARDFILAGYERLIHDLEAATGVAFDEAKLDGAIQVYNDHNRAMRELAKALAAHPEVSAAQRSAVFKSAWFMDKAEHTAWVTELLAALAGQNAGPEKLPIVTTGILADAPGITDLLDEYGFTVAADDVAAESRQYRTDAPADGAPLERLAKKFQAMDCCSVLYDPKKQRVEHIVQLAKDSGAKAVVMLLTKFCDPEEFDYPLIKKACDEAALPMIQIEVDRQMVHYGQARTMLETLRDKLYGSFEDGSAKGVFVTNSGHEDAMINRQGMQIQLDFVQNAMEVPNPIEGSNQIWMWKDIIGLFLMFSFVFTLISLYVFMMEDCKLFQGIRQPLPRNIGLRKVGLTISIVAAIVIPVLITWTGTFGLSTFLKSGGQQLFVVSNSTLTMSLIIGFTIIGAVTLVLFIFTDGKKKHAKLRDYGLTSEGKTGIDWVLIGKSLLLALIVAAAGFSYLRVQRELLGTEIYAWFYGFKPIAWNKIGQYIPYVLVWIVCFAFSALALNVERRLPSTGSEAKDMVIACVFNVVLATVAITVIVFVQQYLQHYVTRLSGIAMGSWAGDITHACWGMPVGLTMGSFGNTYLYRKTGSIWPGAFLMAILCSMSCVLFGYSTFTV